jgi:hypothetical protein
MQLTAFKETRPETISIRFREINPVTIRHIHATLADAENIRYARADGTTMQVRSVSIGLTEPHRKVNHVAVHGTTDDGHHAEDTFMESAREVPAELFDYLYPPAVAQLVTAVITADDHGQPPLCAQCAAARPPAQSPAGKELTNRSTG